MKQEQMQGQSAQIKHRPSIARAVDGNSGAPTLRPGGSDESTLVPPTFAFESLAAIQVARNAEEYAAARRAREAIPSDLIDTVRRDSSRALIAATVAKFEQAEEARAAIATLAPAESVPPTARQGRYLSEQLRIIATRSDAPPALLSDPPELLRTSPARGLPPVLPPVKRVSEAPPARRTQPSLQSISVAVSATNPKGVEPVAKVVDPTRAAKAKANVKPVKATKSGMGGYAAFAMGAAIACGALIFSREAPTPAIAPAAAAAAAPAPQAATFQEARVEPSAAIIELDPLAQPKRPMTTASLAAIATPKKADANDAQDVGSMLRRASAAARQGSTADARTLYLQVTAADPKNSEAWNGLGQIARASGNLEDASTAFSRALAANPRFLPAALALADLAFAAGNHDEAVTRYRDLVDHFPQDLLPAYVAERSH